jgi:Flp pilus assembly protein TadD
MFLPFGMFSAMRKVVIISIVLVVIVAAVYMQVGSHQFLNLDDDAYVTNNPHVTSGMSVNNIVWAFSTFDYIYWQPVTWLSHMLDVETYGLNPGGHHLTNVLIHAVSSVLLLLLLFRLTGAVWQSSLVAFLFALHPLHVESVAWVAERKDVLSTLFWLLTLLVYAEFVSKRTPILYICTLLFFILALMSKPMVLTLPLVMMLMDFWPLNRYQPEKREPELRHLWGKAWSLIIEKTPFIICTLLSAATTIYGQKQYGAMRKLGEMSFLLRIENALVSYVKYIGKTVWPLDMAVLYPFPLSIPLWQVIGSLTILIFISAATLWGRHRFPFFAVGWLWYLVTLVPVSGLLQVGNQSMADRFTYIPGIGLFIMVAWGVPNLLKGLRNQEIILALLGGAVVLASIALTWQQLGYWRNNITLYNHTLHITTNNEIVRNNLGLALANGGDLDAAIAEYQEALRIDPDLAFAHNNLGLALTKKGNLSAAIKEFHDALRIFPNYTEAHNNLGMALANKGDLDAAISEYRQALKINPNYADSHYNLGLAYTSIGNLDAAIHEYQEALRITPNDIDACNNLGAAFAAKGSLDAAISEFQAVLRLSPGNVNANNNLRRALAEKIIKNQSGI